MNKEIEIPEGYEARIEGNKVILEQKESEDERIRKAIKLVLIATEEDRDIFYKTHNLTRKECTDWLEKQKYNRMQPIYDNQESFESALDKAWESYNESGARTVDACEDDYTECAHAKGFREGYLFGLKKQKDQSSSIELPYRSWYMEGYHDAKFKMEPMWLIKTGESGPKYESNPRYGQSLEEVQKSAECSEMDEKIRKALINTLKYSTLDDIDRSPYLDKISREEIISYLERQKEHPMSVGEVLTRAGLKPFKDGNQWCILAGDNIQEGICGFGDTIEDALYQFLVEVFEKQKEQKPEFYPGNVIKCTTTDSLWVRCKGGDNVRSDGHTACIGGGFELANEEEAVQFFQELNENGYQWDCIKGRPIKKEQKYSPLCNTVKDKIREYIANHFITDTVVKTDAKSIVKAMEEGVRLGKEEQKSAECDELQADFRNINEAFEEGKKEVVAHPEKYGLCKPAEIDEYEIIKKHITYDILSSEVNKRLKECGWYVTDDKPAEWSADDEKMMNRVFDSYDALRSYFEDDEVRSEDDKNNLIKELKEEVSWLNNRLKSLHLQPKQEWSEEDEKMRNSIIADYERSNKEWFAAQCSIPWGKKIDWLKALRLQKKCSDCAKNIEGYIHGRSDAENKLLEQFGATITPEGELRMKPQWRPSREQMGALSWMLENARANIDFDPLKDLYEQLKKL